MNRNELSVTDFKKGMLVQHKILGLGKVVALDPNAVHVFFAHSQDSFATKLRLQVAQPLLSASTTTDRWLTGLPAFAFDEKAARYRVSDPGISDAEAIAKFVEAFPGGFTDPKYTGEGKTARERSFRWRRAHDAYVETLGNGEGERLLAAGDVGALVERACLVERHVRQLLAPAERAVLAEALSDAGAARGFFDALFELLAASAPDEARFAALAAAVAALPPGGPRESGWHLATFLPFVAQPDRHMILRPRATCEAASRLRLGLDYRAEPCWTTYASLLHAAGELLEKVRSLGARDHVDVESLMHVATAKQPRKKALEPDAT